MNIIVDKTAMKDREDYAIHEIGIPAIVLMEEAASRTAELLEKRIPPNSRILFLCGCGNNGADALAAARILFFKGYSCELLITYPDQEGTELYRIQKNIDSQLGIPSFVFRGLKEEISQNVYAAIVDGIFGIGLSREITGETVQILETVNQTASFRLAIDIPSGISTDTGAVLGTCFQADATITFGFRKLGLLLHPGTDAAGEITCADIGIRKGTGKGRSVYQLERSDLSSLLPKRPAWSNKGTFGKVLLIAGSRDMAGAAYLSARAAFRTGCGMVRIFTPECNRIPLQTLIPEAILTSYDPDQLSVEKLKEALSWSDSLVIGPGLGQEEAAEAILTYVLKTYSGPMVIDGDALNILSHVPDLKKYLGANCILTPHLGEFSRLTGKAVSELRTDLIHSAEAFAEETGTVCILKDAVSVIADDSRHIYLNTSGCSGMATAGSGDVLTGILGALSGKCSSLTETAALGAMIHGLAGSAAAEKLGNASVMATDLADAVSSVMEA